jgi:hypothetical protein
MGREKTREAAMGGARDVNYKRFIVTSMPLTEFGRVIHRLKI